MGVVRTSSERMTDGSRSSFSQYSPYTEGPRTQGRPIHPSFTWGPSDPGGPRSGRMKERHGFSYGTRSTYVEQLHLRGASLRQGPEATGLGEAGADGVTGATRPLAASAASVQDIRPPAGGPPTPPSTPCVRGGVLGLPSHRLFGVGRGGSGRAPRSRLGLRKRHGNSISGVF